MSWLQKLLPPKIKREAGSPKKVVPEGLWSKCDSCEEVLYRSDLEKNLYVCPKCSHHNRISARERLEGVDQRVGQALDERRDKVLAYGDGVGDVHVRAWAGYGSRLDKCKR